MKLYLWPSEAIVLRHALMRFRNNIATAYADDTYPPFGEDGFELAAADKLIERLDILSEAQLTKNRRKAEAPAKEDPNHVHKWPLLPAACGVVECPRAAAGDEEHEHCVTCGDVRP